MKYKITLYFIMSAGDILLTLFIFGIFFGLTLFNIIGVELAKVRNDWPEYRCNPVVMPLASQLGPPGTDVGTNFEFCIQNMQSDVMSFFLEPIEIVISAIAEIITSIVESLAELSTFFSVFRTLLSSIFGSLYGVIFNSMLQILKMGLTIEDIVRRMTAMLYVTAMSVKTVGINIGAMVNASAQLIAQAEPTSEQQQETLDMVS